MSGQTSAGPILGVLVLLLALAGGAAWYIQSDPVPGTTGAETIEGVDQRDLETTTGGAGTNEERRDVVVEQPAERPNGEADAGTRPAIARVTKPIVATVYGRVVDSRERGIAGARVAAADLDDEQSGLLGAVANMADINELAGEGIRTAEDGSFELGLEKRGKFRLIASHAEHPRAEFRGQTMGDRMEGVVIRMRDGATITGRVLGVPDGAGRLQAWAKKVDDGVVPSVSLIDFSDVLEGFGLALGTRDGKVAVDGAFEIRGLDLDASYHVWAVQMLVDGRFTKQCTSRLDVRAGAHGVELVWRDALTVGLQVVDATSGEPIERLDVSAGFVSYMKMFGMNVPIAARHPLEQKEHPGGQVVIDQLETTDDEQPTLSVGLRAAGYRAWVREDIKAPREGHLDLGVVRLERAPIVHVTVLAHATGAPVAGAEVELVAHDPEAAAAAETRPSGGSFTIGTSISSDNSTGAGNASGISSTSVDLGADEAALSATTGLDGTCEITADLDGHAVLMVRVDGFAPTIGAPFVVPIAGRTEQRVELVQGGTAVVTVVDSYDAPVGRVEVRRTGPVPGDESEESADKDSVATFTGLTPGVHRFALRESDQVGLDNSGALRIDIAAQLGDDEPGVEATVLDGATVAVRLVRPQRCSIRGRVTLDGEALEGATVSSSDLHADDADAAMRDQARQAVQAMLGGLVGLTDSNAAKTDTDGRFELNNVPIGDRRLVVSHAELAMPTTAVVHLVEGENTHDVVILATVVSGTVLGSDGQPLRGAKVSVMVAESSLDAAAIAGLGDAQTMISGLFGATEVGLGTDADGRFELRHVRAGVPLLLRVTARRHIAARLRVEPVAAGGRRDGADFALAAAGRIRVSARGIDGAMAVKAKWDGPDGPDAPSDATSLLQNGRTTLDGLTPGRWKVELESVPERDIEARVVQVEAGGTVRVEF